MQFVSVYFLVFLLIATAGYYLFPKKYQYVFLVLCNFIYSFAWVRKNLRSWAALLAVILITYAGAIMLDHVKKPALLWTVVICTLAGLIYFKYADFILRTAGRISGRNFGTLQPVMPVGISFFTFQALGYVIDVYRGKYRPEKNPVRYAAFVTFFPTVTSGPIERGDGLLRDLQSPAGRKISWENVAGGFTLFLYGTFVKLVVTDRLSLVADTIFNNYLDYGGAVLLLGAVVYTIQIYCDFSSYSLLAMGTAKILGFSVMENFKAPYLSESVQEFWRRWHVSLSTWFRDYVYIPLGGSRCSTLRKNFNLMVTFLVSGLWHGADWSFVLWGALHGIYQITGNLTKKIRKRTVAALHMNPDCVSFHLWRKFFTFSCVAFAWIFFRCPSIRDALGYIGRMFTEPALWQLTDGTVYQLGLDALNLTILRLGLLLVLAVDLIRYYREKNIDVFLKGQNAWFRIVVLVFMLDMAFVFGEYGPAFRAQDFIYFQF